MSLEIDYVIDMDDSKEKLEAITAYINRVKKGFYNPIMTPTYLERLEDAYDTTRNNLLKASKKKSKEIYKAKGYNYNPYAPRHKNQCKG